MELDFAVDRSGNIDPAHAARYKEFGAWIHDCYGYPYAQTKGFINSTVVELGLWSAQHGDEIDRLMLLEDLTYGEVRRTLPARSPRAPGGRHQLLRA
jgi:hypothetical protein